MKTEILPGELRLKRPKVRQSRLNRILSLLRLDDPRYEVTYRFEYRGKAKP